MTIHPLGLLYGSLIVYPSIVRGRPFDVLGVGGGGGGGGGDFLFLGIKQHSGLISRKNILAQKIEKRGYFFFIKWPDS